METASILKRFFFCERSLIISQAAWLASVAPFEVKTALPRFVWQHAIISQNSVSHIDFLTPNETELRILLGLSPDDPTPTQELAKRLQARGVRNVIVTMGAEGALVLADSEMRQVPGVKVDVVDTTGAGDAFNAALAVAVAEGRPRLEAVRFATCAGALNAQNWELSPVCRLVKPWTVCTPTSRPGRPANRTAEWGTCWVPCVRWFSIVLIPSPPLSRSQLVSRMTAKYGFASSPAASDIRTCRRHGMPATGRWYSDTKAPALSRARVRRSRMSRSAIT
jgi:hypothetical protein